MVEQVRITDDTEDKVAWEFIESIIAKYNIWKSFAGVEIRTRTIAYDTCCAAHPTDDKLLQLVVDNRLVAFVLTRRDDWNHSEVTKVFLEDTLEKCKDFKDIIIKNKISLE